METVIVVIGGIVAVIMFLLYSFDLEGERSDRSVTYFFAILACAMVASACLKYIYGN